MDYKITIEFYVPDTNSSLNEKLTEMFIGHLQGEEIPLMHILPKEVRCTTAYVKDVRSIKSAGLGGARELDLFAMDVGGYNIAIPNKFVYGLLITQKEIDLVGGNLGTFKNECRKELAKRFLNDNVPIITITEAQQAHGNTFAGLFITYQAERDPTYPLSRLITLCNVKAQNIYKI